MRLRSVALMCMASVLFWFLSSPRFGVLDSVVSAYRRVESLRVTRLIFWWEMAGDPAASSASEFPNPVLPDPSVKYPIQVAYCGVCTLPVEYCEWSPDPEKCKEWLKKSLPGQFQDLSVAGGEESAGGSKTEEPGADGAEGDDDKKKRQTRGGKARVKLPTAEEKKKPSLIKLSIASRGKKKYVTVVTGLGTHGIDLKLAAKTFGQKFACGSSLTGDDEIVIQGDVKDDLFDFIPEKWPEIDEDLLEDLGEQKR